MKKLLFVFVGLFFFGCQQEEPAHMEMDQQQKPPVNSTNFNDLPNRIKAKVAETRSGLLRNNISSKEKDRNFGNIIETDIRTGKDTHDNDIYTFRLSKNKKSNYIDVLTIKERKDSSLQTNIIRHDPGKEWLDMGNDKSMGNFSGSVSFYNENGDFQLSAELENGAIKKGKKSGSKAGKSCLVLDVQHAGLVQNGVYTITSTMYTLLCYQQDEGIDMNSPDSGVNGQNAFNGQQTTITFIADEGDGGGGPTTETVTCPAGSTLDLDTQTCVEIKKDDPSCESFVYYPVGNTGVQVAGVDGIWDVVTKWGRCPGIGAAISYRTYYFHLPSHWSSGYAANKSAAALESAFYDLQTWFRKQKCKQTMVNALAIKMDEFIRAEFKKIGGQANRHAPLGWTGEVVPYKEDWDGNDVCY